MLWFWLTAIIYVVYLEHVLWKAIWLQILFSQAFVWLTLFSFVGSKSATPKLIKLDPEAWKLWSEWPLLCAVSSALLWVPNYGEFSPDANIERRCSQVKIAIKGTFTVSVSETKSKHHGRRSPLMVVRTMMEKILYIVADNWIGGLFHNYFYDKASDNQRRFGQCASGRSGALREGVAWCTP